MQYTTSEPMFKLPPVGTFEATITEVGEYNNPNGQNKLVVEFTFNDPDTLDEVKKKEFLLPTISEGDGFRVFGDLLKLLDKDIDTQGDFDEQELLDKKCMITIKHTEGKGKHEGKTFANITMVEPVKKNTK
mgnify:FL=1